MWKEIGGTRTYFWYSDEGLVGEYDAVGTEIRTYGWKPGTIWSTDPLFMKQGAKYYYYHNDHLGTPQKITSANGAVVWSATYGSFGKATVDPSSTITNNLRFPGQYYDEETGLHYNFQRYYDAEGGRYLRIDPIGFGGGDVNLYDYVWNAPINWIDPWGLDVIYGNIIVTNPLVREALERLDKDLPGTDVIVTGGDRYYDEYGNIRSTSNNSLIRKSAPYTTHLQGLGVDFVLSDMTPTKELIEEYFDWGKIAYPEEYWHVHGDLRNQGRECTEGIQPQ